MKTIAFVLTLAFSGTIIGAAYTAAHASRMNGKDMGCSEGVNCMSARYKMAPSKKAHVTKPKTGN
jgi:hypothetical protein